MINVWQISTDYACFGLIEQGEVVKMAAPIANWTLGKNIVEVLDFYITKKNATVTVQEMSDEWPFENCVLPEFL